jgi:hypothetical protein
MVAMVGSLVALAALRVHAESEPLEVEAREEHI